MFRARHPTGGHLNSNRIQTAVFLAIGSLNETLPADGQIPLRTEASLGGLESLAITNLIVAVEDAMREVLGVEISLTDERTLALFESKDLTPLRTVGTLIEHLRQSADGPSSSADDDSDAGFLSAAKHR